MARILTVIFFMIVSHYAAMAGTAKVLAVYAGDSLKVEMQGEALSLKLYGIDAPESGQAGNVAATRFLKHLAAGLPVEVELVGEDGFGRPLAVLTRKDRKLSINASIVANGYAWVKPSECHIEDCIEMKALESQARTLKLGSLSNFDAVPPWEFRERHNR